MIPALCLTSLAYAAASDYSGLAGPAMLLWAISHPIETIKGLFRIPGDRRRQEAYAHAIAKCQAEERTLPNSVEIDSFIDEGAALRGDLIYELLLKRNVKAIYVRPQPVGDGKELRYGYPDGEYIGQFTYPASASPQPKGSRYIKLELGHEDEKNCLPEGWTPLYIQDRYKIPPALPKTCLAYSFTDKPQTHYALRYDPTRRIANEQFGIWSIVDLATQKAIVSLTTVDSPPQVSSGGPADCRSPYTVLAWRIKPDSNSQNTYLVKQTTIVASPSFPELIAKSDSLPLIQMSTAKTPFRNGEWEAGGSVSALRTRWHEAVDEAKKSGVGHYSGEGAGYRFSPDYRIEAGAHGRGRLLDWSTRNLIGLQLVETGSVVRGSINWDVSASERGFLVFTNEWGNGKSQIVARYSINGTLDWAVQVPRVPKPGNCGFGPREAWTTDAEIVLSQPSCNNTEGTEWRIKKRDIPFYKLPVARVRQPDASLHPQSRQ